MSLQYTNFKKLKLTFFTVVEASTPLTQQLNDLLHELHSWAASPILLMPSSDPNLWHYSTVLGQQIEAGLPAKPCGFKFNLIAETGRFIAFPSKDKNFGNCNRNSRLCASVITADTWVAGTRTCVLVVSHYTWPLMVSVNFFKCMLFSWTVEQERKCS